MEVGLRVTLPGGRSFFQVVGRSIELAGICGILGLALGLALI